jgi:hypothetical protein
MKLAIVALLVVGFSAVPARGVNPCVAGTYQSVEGTDCTIGSLLFHFGQGGGEIMTQFSSDASTSLGLDTDAFVYASAFDFIPTNNGFIIQLDPNAQIGLPSGEGFSSSYDAADNSWTLTAAQIAGYDNQLQFYASLQFDVRGLNGTLIEPMGPFNEMVFPEIGAETDGVDALAIAQTINSGEMFMNGSYLGIYFFNEEYESFGDGNYSNPTYDANNDNPYQAIYTGSSSPGDSFVAGSDDGLFGVTLNGGGYVSNLNAGASGGFGPTSYFFETYNPPPVPEPSSLLLLGTGALCLMGFVGKRAL